jgi:hypothetical protein
MPVTLLKLPDSLDDLADDELLQIPATYAEYLDVVDTVPYTVQFLNDELILSQASADHETLVARLISLLITHFDELPEPYRVMGSNVKIVIPGMVGDFNAQPFVSVYSRTNVPDEWLNHDYRSLDSTVRLGETLTLPMQAIYRKVRFA